LYLVEWWRCLLTNLSLLSNNIRQL
jgi:hypothetical protein